MDDLIILEAKLRFIHLFHGLFAELALRLLVLKPGVELHDLGGPVLEFQFSILYSLCHGKVSGDFALVHLSLKLRDEHVFVDELLLLGLVDLGDLLFHGLSKRCHLLLLLEFQDLQFALLLILQSLQVALFPVEKLLLSAFQFLMKFFVSHLRNYLLVSRLIHREYLSAVRAFDLLHCFSPFVLARSLGPLSKRKKSISDSTLRSASRRRAYFLYQ